MVTGESPTAWGAVHSVPATVQYGDRGMYVYLHARYVGVGAKCKVLGCRYRGMYVRCIYLHARYVGVGVGTEYVGVGTECKVRGCRSRYGLTRMVVHAHIHTSAAHCLVLEMAIHADG